jgi:DNA-binding HxlR family transcriptional regulator
VVDATGRTIWRGGRLLQYQICTEAGQAGPGGLTSGEVGSSYYQFCPVAKAMELLDERWTLLVIRELLSGSRRFNELRRGLPRMSPALLSKRLHQLARAGVLERRTEGADGAGVEYVLTEAGHELRPVIEALGAWGTRWIGELGDRDLDPKLLLWDMRRNVERRALPPGRTVIEFTFPDAAAGTRHWWMVITPDEVDVCDADPGHPVAVSVTASLRRMVEVWRGDLGWYDAIRSGGLEVYGPQALRRALPGWFSRSPFASVPRPQAHHQPRPAVATSVSDG